MLKKIALLIIIFLPMVSAELIIPNNMDITVKLNSQQNFSLNLSNTFNFRLTDFEFKNLTGFIFPDIILEPNETRQITFSVLQTEIKNALIDSEISFKYLVDIPNSPRTFPISIGQNGFSPDFLSIHEGDTIIWTNNDDISHTVTSSTFDHELQPNQSIQKTFSQIGTIDYNDFILFWGGRIEVLNKSLAQKVNNPNYNKPIKINLNVLANPTNLSLLMQDTVFKVDATGSKEGLLSIENIGQEVAQRVLLNSDSNWISFERNNFNIEKGQKVFVIFKIQPLILSANETNRSYNFNIKTKALNTQEYNSNIAVTIPFSNTFDQFDTNEGFFNWFNNVYCPQHQELFICNTTAITQQQPRIIIKDPEIPINLTASQLYAALKRIQQIADSNARTDNKVKAVSEYIEQEFPNFKLLIEESNKKAEDTEERRRTTEIVLWIIGIFIIITVAFIVFWNQYSKWKYKKYLMGG